MIKNKKLILGGIEIKSDYGLLGHSDADCLLHAISESIIGALGLGDLGDHFCDKDINNKNLDSQIILNYCKNLLLEYEYSICNIDTLIHCQSPNLKTYKKKMNEKIAQILNIKKEIINIKATTGEKIGFIGRKEGLTCESIILIKKNK